MKNSQLSEKDRAIRSKIRMKMSNLRSKLKDFEKEDNTKGSQELACTAGVCELVDI